MVIIELTYKKPLTAVEQYLPEHRHFLTELYGKGIFLLSGPKIPREGGVILSKGTLNEAKELIKNDPFYIHDIADYHFLSFEPNRYHAEFKQVLE